MRPRPHRLERLPDQYFAALLRRVALAAADGGEPVVDLGRGNPELGPPPHVVERLARAADDPRAHGYPPFAGLAELREAIVRRYAGVYGVELDPEREVAVVPGTKTSLVELALVLAERGDTVLLPDPRTTAPASRSPGRASCRCRSIRGPAGRPGSRAHRATGSLPRT